MSNKTITTTNPYTLKEIKTYNKYSKEEVFSALSLADTSYHKWKTIDIKERISYLENLAHILEDEKARFAQLITEEMGKPISESIAETEKCISLCDFYVANAEDFLADAVIETEAYKSFISYDPIGVVLAIMPWNYPFWQVFRFAIPNITAGNTALLKHASNVTGCALAIEAIFKKANYPEGIFQTLLTSHDVLEELIEDKQLKAVSLTGSEKAGKAVAKNAGNNLKKTVLELGGNNACIILKDADLDTHLNEIVKARYQNTGQSCIAAKRFIVVSDIYDEFLEQFTKKVKALKVGNPIEKDTEISVLARPDLAKELKNQVDESLKKGAKLHYGNKSKNAFYEPTIITNVTSEMPIFKEETFGPVAAIIKVKSEEEAYKLASQSDFGLGTMVFTKAIEKARKKIIKIPDGAFFINSMVKSHPSLPFGGTKNSGYGRELSKEGMLEFVNKKTIYINK